MTALLEIEGLCVDYGIGEDAVHAVVGADLVLHPGEVLGLAGESGSGKSTLAYAAIRLLRAPGIITGGEVRYHPASGQTVDLLAADEEQLRSLRWSQIDLRHGRLHVNRAKGGIESVHPLHGPELRVLRPLQGSSPYVFTTEAGTPVTTSWFLRMIQRTGRAAKLPFPIHPHMLRHSTGYKLANQGEDTRSLAHYLGHRNLQSTAIYTALAPDRFAKFWKD